MEFGRDIVGRELHDRNGIPAGLITAFYRYPSTFGVAWGLAEVSRRAMMLKSIRIVDLHGARLENDHIVVEHELGLIRRAPVFRPMIGDVLADSDAADLLAFYGHTS